MVKVPPWTSNIPSGTPASVPVLVLVLIPASEVAVAELDGAEALGADGSEADAGEALADEALPEAGGAGGAEELDRHPSKHAPRTKSRVRPLTARRMCRGTSSLAIVFDGNRLRRQSSSTY
jgi:hypothetical protein